MPLSKFELLTKRDDESQSFGCPVVQCFDDEQMVLAFIERSALDDYFRVPGDERHTLDQWNLVVAANQSAINQIIAAKYDRGEISTHEAAGMEYPRVVVTLADLQSCGERLRDDVLKLQAGFQRR